MADLYPETDLGDIVLMEHFNLEIEDQKVGLIFYCEGMGFARDPHERVSVPIMWVNVGFQQFHLILTTSGDKPQKVDGCIVLVFPKLKHLIKRLQAVEEKLRGTQFAFKMRDDTMRGLAYLEITEPYGNTFKVYANNEDHFHTRGGLGIVQVEVFCRQGTAKDIGTFYENILGAPALRDVEGEVSIVVGPNQRIVYKEKGDILKYDGYHVALYSTKFSKLFVELQKRNLIFCEVY
eukprot:TRINITY_DN5940_c0_g1_i1.p1 TRINITY_DN5940_c0_g1~~TRINITY_DN5940_c0_g1_i1.p1  ORF type:complete len:252 (-),score=6.63 TRINITY_DN5940_c0_g1_i1:254-958(-)